MTDFTTYSDDTPSVYADWLTAAIAPTTTTMEKPSRKVPKVLIAGLFAVGMSGSISNGALADFMPIDGSSIMMANPIELRPVPLAPVSLSSPVKQLSAVQLRFGLTKVGLARVCRVERQTIYEWYNEKFSPMRENARRLDALYQLADSSMKKGIPALDPRLSERLLSNGQTLIDFLSAEILNNRGIEQAINELAEFENRKREGSAKSIRERLGWKASSTEQQNANLEYNLGQRRQG